MGGRATPESSRPLGEAGPVVGQNLLIDGHAWTVTEHATYRNDEGYFVDEWECHSGSDIAYLLKEGHERPKWLFTRAVPPASVEMPGGEPVDRWLAHAADARSPGGLARPPSTLSFRGQTYTHADTTDGTYQDASGERSAKTTWEYWDAKREWNLAIERWPDGDVDCYHGRYVERHDVHIRSGAARAGAHPVAAWTIVAAALFFFLATLELPIDVCLSVGLMIMALGGVVLGGFRYATTGRLAVIAAPALALLFCRFPPLTSAPGLAAVVLVPAVTTRWAIMRDAGGARHGAVRASFVCVTAAVLVGGLYHYFWFAPGPHSFGQYAVALGPAPLAGGVAAVMARLVVKISD